MFELILQTTPNTNNYMIGGYAVFFTVMIIYLVRLVVRYRNMKRDLATLEELEQK